MATEPNLGQIVRGAFGSATPARFWRRWNPALHRFLLRSVYVPLRRVLPHTAALILTFAVSGLGHDVLIGAFLLVTGSGWTPFPFVTVAFVVLAVVVVVFSRRRWSFERLSFAQRAVAHSLLLVAAFAASFGLSLAV